MVSCPAVTVVLPVSVRPCGREPAELEGEEPDGEQAEPEGGRGLQGVREGGDGPVDEGAPAAGGEDTEGGAGEDRHDEGEGGQQDRPADAFGDDVGDGLAHHGGVAEVSGERAGDPLPPADGERLVDAEVGAELVEVLLRGGESGGPGVRLDGVERGGVGDGEDGEGDGQQDGHGEEQPPPRHARHGYPGQAGPGLVHLAGFQSSTFHQGPEARPWSWGSTWVVRVPKRLSTT